jgi:hypothetical protein
MIVDSWVEKGNSHIAAVRRKVCKRAIGRRWNDKLSMVRATAISTDN